MTLSGTRDVEVYWKISDGTESSVTATHNSGSYQLGHALIEIKGAHATTPIDNTSTYDGSGNTGTTTILPAINPSNNETMFIAFGSFEDNDCASFSYSSGFVSFGYKENSSGLDSTHGLGAKWIGSGGSTSTTITADGASSDQRWGILAAIVPVGGEIGGGSSARYSTTFIGF